VVDLTGTGAQDAAIGQVAWDKLSMLWRRRRKDSERNNGWASNRIIMFDTAPANHSYILHRLFRNQSKQDNAIKLKANQFEGRNNKQQHLFDLTIYERQIWIPVVY
jgi:hypothetical protein